MGIGVNYTDIGLTAAEIAELKTSYRKTGWRFKLLRPTGTKLFDPATAVTTKIDAAGGSALYPLNTEGDKYIKMAHDERHNRTFILHRNPLNTTTLAVVSIINHFLEKTDPDYIETLRANTATDWPAEFGASSYALDMAYNPDADELAIALPGVTPAPGSTFGPGIMVVNTQKYAAEIALNTCATLDDNPDYLKCEIWRADSDLQDAGARSYVKFVRYHHGKYWTFTRCDDWGGVAYQEFWQLGYFNAKTSAFTFVFQSGWAPSSTDLRPDGGTWNATSVQYPQAPRYSPMYAGMGVQTGTVDGYIGDPSNCITNVTAFEIVPEGGGQILIVCSPDTFTQGFGFEPMVYRISIPMLLTELTAASRLIATNTLTVAATNHAGTYVLDKNFETLLQTGLLGQSGGGLISISALCVTLGTTYMYVENDYGTTAAVFTGAGPYKAHNELFIGDADSVTVKFAHPDIGSSPTPFSVTWTISVYKAIPGLIEIIGVHSTPALARPTDTDRPVTVTGNFTTPITYSIEVAQYAYPTGEWNCCRHAYYSIPYSKFVLAMDDYGSGGFGAGQGLYVYRHQFFDERRTLNIYDSSSGLAYDYVGAISALNQGALLLATNDSTNPSAPRYGDNGALQWFNIYTEEFLTDALSFAFGYAQTAIGGACYDTKENRFGFVTEKGMGTGVWGEIWFYTPPLGDGEWSWSRDIRVWWDGTNPDLIMGVGAATGGNPEQPWVFESPQFSQSKSSASYSLTFEVSGYDYLPWAVSDFNNAPDFALVADSGGMLADGTRVILERGVYTRNSGVWNWIQEGQFFVEKGPVRAETGVANMSVTCGGPISMLVTRGVYYGTHKPDTTDYVAVALTAIDPGTDTIYQYIPIADPITNWVAKPIPKIYVNGVQVYDYDLSTAAGTITFTSAQTGNTITATFSAYDSGTNEAEDIILCILRYPNDIGGCGLDDSYFTRLINGATLTTDDYLTYSFDKNNVVDSDAYNAIYRDTVLQTAGVDYDWNYRDGSVTFYVSQSGHAITGDCKYYTIQKSGATLQPLSFNPKKFRDSHECIQEVCRRVAPNYIFREGRDGKLEVDFFTQKSAGSEDLSITNTDYCITEVAIEPMYEGLATRVLSYGQADLDQLPDLCLGKTVSDDWSSEGYSWHAGQNMQNVTDGDPATGVTSGFGGWGDGTYTVQAALVASGETGIPCLSVDMGAVYEVETIIIARPSQTAAETTVQNQSIWVSNDGSAWSKLVDGFDLMPGANQQFKAGTNYDEGTKFQYIRVNLHSLGLYTNSKGSTDSQMGFSEIQCYESEEIEGEAHLVDDDPTSDVYDQWGLLEKYGYINYIARSGTPDSMLYTKELADDDAKFNLLEIVRLVSKVEIHAPWFPAIPIFSTITITNATLGTSQTYFIEQRDAGESGDSFIGMTLP